MEANDISEHLQDHKKETNNLCQLRLTLSETSKTKPWSMDDLMKVLYELKSDKARDALGHANEIFSLNFAEVDLILAILKLKNLINVKQQYPSSLSKCNVTSIHKKGAYKTFENYL